MTEQTPEIVSLFPDRPSAAPSSIDPEVIAVLEELLAKARDGRCFAIAVCTFESSGQHRNVCIGKIAADEAIGALELLKLRIALSWNQRNPT